MDRRSFLGAALAAFAMTTGLGRTKLMPVVDEPKVADLDLADQTWTGVGDINTFDNVLVFDEVSGRVVHMKIEIGADGLFYAREPEEL